MATKKYPVTIFFNKDVLPIGFLELEEEVAEMFNAKTHTLEVGYDGQTGKLYEVSICPIPNAITKGKEQ